MLEKEKVIFNSFLNPQKKTIPENGRKHVHSIALK